MGLQSRASSPYLPLSLPQNKLIFVLGALLAAAGIDTALSHSSLIIPFNMAVFSAIRGIGVDLPWMTALTIFITYLGSGPVLFAFVIALFFVLLIWKRPADAKWFVAAAVFGQITSSAAKILVRLPRPDLVEPPLTSFSGYSFPSGHALMSSVVYGTAVLLSFRYFRRKSARMAAGAVGVALILAIGFSRIYLGVHWANDVLGGYLYGVCILLVGYLLRFGERKR